jgi:hypothetical protein
MSAAYKMNFVDFIAVQFGGTGSHVPLPTVGDYEILDPAALTPEFCAANGLVAPTNYEQGMSVKLLAVNVAIDPCWFTAANLLLMAINRDADGYLSPLGKLMYRDGGVIRHFSHCKAASVQIVCVLPTAASPGALFARLFLYAYGSEIAVGSPTFADTTPMGIFQPGLVDFKATDGGTNTVNGVFGFSLTLSNNLIPFVTLPLATPGGEILPEECSNGPVSHGIMLDQLRTASLVQDGTTPTDTKEIIIRLKNPAGTKVVITSQVLLPNRNSPHQKVGVARIRRDYPGIKPNLATAPVVIAAGA